MSSKQSTILSRLEEIVNNANGILGGQISLEETAPALRELGLDIDQEELDYADMDNQEAYDEYLESRGTHTAGIHPILSTSTLLNRKPADDWSIDNIFDLTEWSVEKEEILKYLQNFADHMLVQLYDSMDDNCGLVEVPGRPKSLGLFAADLEEDDDEVDTSPKSFNRFPAGEDGPW